MQIQKKQIVLRVGLLLVVLAVLLVAISSRPAPARAATGPKYIVIAWNDLGMHCYNKDFSNMAVLPPYNNVWAQVIKMGDPPQLVTSGVTVSYSINGNTYSAGKTNFWQYAKPLFGVDLQPNVGLKSKGLSGTMDLQGDHFVAEGVPVTEFSDKSPKTPNPYQTATVIVYDATTGAELARTTTVTPVSSEMRCDNCHKDKGKANPAIATHNVDTNILTLHDQKENTSLMQNRPILCASCHGSNALGAAGQPGVENLSNAMHNRHSSVIPNTLKGCYNCHPGPKTKCLRDVMSKEEGMTCISCHGGMSKVALNPNPWLNEPRCDNCHQETQQNNALYRFSTGHGGLYCEACHDSTHAIAPSSNPADGKKFIALQGSKGPLEKCTVCHLSQPSGPGPHGNSGD